MKKYFNEKEKLNVDHATENPHRPKTNSKGYVVGFEKHDITLYFEPVDEAMKNAIGTLEIKTGADEITWGYGMNTKRYPTYGGEVVQILSTYADKMTIRGTCLEYKTLTKIYEYFKDYLLYTTGGATLLTGSDNGGLERKQKFLKFTYPARKWSFVIMIAEANGFRIARDVAAPQWEITAEIVSENDRYRLGSERIDRFANVLSTPVSTGTRGSSGADGNRTKRSPESITSSGQEEDPDVLRLPKNFQIERAGDPFGNLMDFANGKRGKIAENFHALIANWATGDVSTVFNNPLVDPEKTEDEIWTEKFGSLEIAGGTGATGDGSTGTGGGGTPVGDPATGGGSIVWGEKKRVFATAYGGAGDDNGIGSGGKILKDYPDSYAELSTNKFNSANGTPADGVKNNYSALGKLAYETPIRVTYKGKSKILYKRDVGFGGPGPDGQRGTSDDPKIDLWHTAAKQLGFGGFDWVEIEIGTPGAAPSIGLPSIGNDVAWPVPNPKSGEWVGGRAEHLGRCGKGAGENWQSCHAVDLFRPAGTAVYAIADGVITGDGFGMSDPSSGSLVYGARMHIKTKYGTFFYQHMNFPFAPGIKQGGTVKVGQLLGTVTDYNNADHLHLGMKNDNFRSTDTITPTLEQIYKKVTGK